MNFSSLRSFLFLPKNFVGVDIGTSAIKMVEVSGWGNQRRLKSYGELRSATFYETPFRTFQWNTLFLSSKEVARAIRAIQNEAGIHSTKAVFSLPDFSSFF